jgi:hypothetical protein
MAFRQVRRDSGGVNLDTVEWQPDSTAAGLQYIPSMTTGNCMMYVVARSTKVASHYIANIDNHLGINHPGLSLRYWQPTDSWFAYSSVVGTGGSVSNSAVSYTAGTKVLLGVRVSGTSLSMSINGAITTGGTAVPFTAARAILNNGNSADLIAVDDSYTVVGYSDSLAQRIEGFLAWKHGITLAAGHPYRTATPTYEWKPSDDPDLKIWYDFADSSTVTITGAGISNLTNKAISGGYTLTQGTDTDRPSWDGSKATARWSSGSSVGLNITASIPWTNSAYTALMTADPTTGNTTSGPRVFAARTSTTVNHAVFTSAASLLSYRASTTTLGGQTLLSGYSRGSLRLITTQFDGATNKKAWIAGNSVMNHTSADNGPKLCDNFQLLSADGNNILGDFIVTSSISTSTRQRLEGYLAWKQELQTSLPSDHPYRFRKPVYQEWEPSDDPGLLIWYDFADASTITITGAGISQITNKAGAGGFTLVQATDASRPSWDGGKATGRDITNGLGGLWITTTINWTNAAYLQVSTVQYSNFNGTSFAREWRVSDGASASYHHVSLESASNNVIGRFNNTAGTTGEYYSESNYIADPTLVVRSRTFSGGASGTAVTLKNGTQTSSTTNANINPVVGSAFGLLPRATNIAMGDFIISSNVTDAMRQKHEGYLAWKRGLAASLDASHPYKTRPPLTTD